LRRKTSLTTEFTLPQNSDHGFLSLFGDNGQFNLAPLNIKNRLRLIALRKDDLGRMMVGN
jgi:hypothetical protein